MRALAAIALLLGASGFAADAGVGTQIKDPFAGLPEVVSSVPIAGEMSSMGVPVMARAVRTRLTPELAQRWIVGSFRRNNLYIPPPNGQFQLQGAPQVTGYDPVAFRTYTAVFKKNDDGSTTLVCGTADVSRQDWASPRASLPVLPAAKQILQSRLESALTLSFVVVASEAEVRGFYGDVLGASGWSSIEEGWSKDGKVITVQQTPGVEGQRRVLVVERSAGATRDARP